MSRILELLKNLVFEGDVRISVHAYYVAEIDVEYIYTDTGWSPYISLQDAYKMDDVRDALRKGDVVRAASLARVYTLTPVAV